MKELLGNLSGIAGPPGHESAVREAVRREVEPLADEVRVDALGSLLATKAFTRMGRGGRRVLITARMDEAALVASHVEAGGWVRFQIAGAVDRGALLGARVRFLNGRVGLVGAQPGEEGKTPSLTRLFIDLGAAGPKDNPVRTGDMAVFDTPFTGMGGHVTGKALGSRAGLAAAVEALRRLDGSPHELAFAFTSRDQTGSRSAEAAAHSLDPEIVIALAMTPAGDLPGSAPGGAKLGGGPIIVIGGGGSMAAPKVVEWMERSARRARLAVQPQVLDAGQTGVLPWPDTRAGVLTGGLALPTRYLNTPTEMIAMQDLENTVRLLVALLRSEP